MDVPKPKIRYRSKPGGHGTSDPRLITDPPDANSKKRKPNSGSWKKGDCPNPHGRPKGAKSLKTIARMVLSEKVTIRSAKGPKKVGLMEGLIRKEVELAVGGDWRARRTLLELSRWSSHDAAEGSNDKPELQANLPASAQAILDMYAEEVLARGKATVNDNEEQL